MSDDVTNADRAQWAAEALAAYNDRAPRDVLSLSLAQRVRIGIEAAEAMARETRTNPAEQVVDNRETADELITDLMAYVFHLAFGRIIPDQLIRAAEEIRRPIPGTADTMRVLAAIEVDRVAAMLAALMDAAAAYGCDLAVMLANARGQFETDMAEEADERLSA
ncbi:hypothetical protein [Streptomyces atacamensis]|uniref:hypothetical protein n=1 Tax=Streptomyces atacamensis TaxID=531966 RepID=UPI00399D5442